MSRAMRHRIGQLGQWARSNPAQFQRYISSVPVEASLASSATQFIVQSEGKKCGHHHTTSKGPSNFEGTIVSNYVPDTAESFIGKTGGQIFHEMMVRHDVRHIFGYPGGCILPVFDAIHESKHFDFILPRHEQGGGHMAQGYARATGKPGVVLVTSGPGATNLITPMMDALADGTPMVVFCGQVSTTAIGTDGFQEADVLSMSQPCTKWNVSVRKTADLPKRIDEAFEIALSGRPGPVLVELPKDVTAGFFSKLLSVSAGRLKNTSSLSTKVIGEAQHRLMLQSIEAAADLINIAERPVIYAGQGILATSEGPQLLKELAEKSSVPVTTSLQGLGAFDEMDPKALHMLGLHGSGYANLAIQNADLILALGARFDDRMTGSVPKFAPKAKLAANEKRGGIVHFDISPKNINKVVEADVSVVGDCAESLRILLPRVKPTQRPKWLSQIQSWKRQYPFQAVNHSGDSEAILPQHFIEKLSDAVDPIKETTLITTGVGQHQMWAAQHFRWRYPRTMITSGGLGTMGYGLPAAIGAKIARPDALVIDIDGDASFNMTINELATASQFGVDIKVVLLNNEEQGMVTHLQTVYFDNRFCHSHNLNPDFVEAARAMGVQAQCCFKNEDIDKKLNWLLNTRGPALLEVKVARKALSLPMVPGGCGLDEFQYYN